MLISTFLECRCGYGSQVSNINYLFTVRVPKPLHMLQKFNAIIYEMQCIYELNVNGKDVVI